MTAHPGTPDEKPADPYLAMLEEWKKALEEAAAWREKENELRRQLFAGAFPEPKEGVNRHLLPDGRTIKGTQKVTRKLEESTYAGCLATLRERGVANVDSLVRYNPELVMKEWKALSDANKLIFSDAVIATIGMPTLEIEAPKKKR